MRMQKRGLARVSFTIAFLVLISLILLTQTKLSKAETYQVGDKIKLDLESFGKYDLKIITPYGTTVTKEKKGSIVFRPPQEGQYQIIVEGENGNKIFEFTVGESKEKVEEQDVLVHLDEIINEPIQEQNQIFQATSKTKRNGQIKVGLPVTWIEKRQVDDTKKIKLPKNAKIYKVEEKLLETEQTEVKTEIPLEQAQGQLEIEYTTPAPQVEEKEIDDRTKEVLVYSPPDQDYQNVISFTTIPEYTSHKELIKIYWKEEEKYIENFEAKDTDNNGLLDYVEWVVPHLSNQTFNITIDILNVQSYPVVGGNWSVRFLTSGRGKLTIRAFNETTWTENPSDPESYDLRFLQLSCDGETIDYDWSQWTDSVIVNNWECNDLGIETSKVLTAGVHDLEFCFGNVCKYAHNDAADPEFKLVGEWGHTLDIQQSSWTQVNFTNTFDDIPVVIHHLESDYNYDDTPCQTRITNVTTTGFLIRSESWDAVINNSDCPATGLNSFWLAMERGIHNLTNNGAVTRTVEVVNFTMDRAACGNDNDWTWTPNRRNFTNAWSFEPIVIPSIQTANDDDAITWYARGCTTTTGDEWTNTCVEVGLSGMQNDLNFDPCGNHTLNETGGYIAWQMNADWTNAESRDNSGTFGAGNYRYYWEAFWESNSVRGSDNDPYVMSAYFVTLSQTWNDGAAWWNPNSINNANGWLPLLDFDDATNRVYLLADEDQNEDQEQNHATENGNVLFFNSSSGYIFSNVTIDNQPPRWLNISLNKTNPSVNEYVNFSSSWYDPAKMKSWTFYWDIGSGFVPAGSGTFASLTNETATIEKQIPTSAEGKTIYLYFRATDFWDKENQTETRNFSVQDTSPPSITEESVTPQIIIYGEYVTIRANVSDTTGVDTVLTQITQPNNARTNQTLSNISLDIFELNYTSTQIGRYNATIFANDTNGITGNNSILLQWNVTGWANVLVSYPQSGSFAFGEQLSLVCEVADANQSSAITNYPVNFYADGNLLGTNSTNSSGKATFGWTITGGNVINFNCTIQNNETLFYNSYIANSNSSINVLVPNVEFQNLSHENLQYWVSNGWYDPDWAQRKSITIPSGKVSSDLTDFPMLVEIYDTNLRNKTLSTGNDILFTSSDGTTKIPHEIETFNQTYNSTHAYLAAWVKVNLTSSSSTTIYLYYNNSVAGNQENVYSVWSDYLAVWNIPETDDKSGNGRNLTTANPPTNISGKFGQAGDFDGTNDVFTTAQASDGWLNGLSSITVQTLIEADNIGAGDEAFYSQANTGGSDVSLTARYDQAGFLVVGGTNLIKGSVDTTGGTSAFETVSNTQTTSWLWHTTSWTSGEAAILYLNGTTATWGTGGAPPVRTGTTAFTAGNFIIGNGPKNLFWDGSIDYVRIRNDVLSSAWVQAEFDNQRNPTNFYNVNSEENPPTSSGLNEYETYDNIAWINVTVNNTGQATATNVSVTLNLLFPNQTIADWFTQRTNSCGTLTVGQSCQTEFTNLGSGYSILTQTSGIYQFNVSSNWSGGGNIQLSGLYNFTIHQLPNNFTGHLTDSEITKEENTTYEFNFTNPWSSPLTQVNVTINCPTANGLQCFCGTNTSTQTCQIGTISSLETKTIYFNITTNSSIALGNYYINVTVRYINPTNNQKTWTEYQTDRLIVRPLLAVIEVYPNSIIRGTSTNISGYAQNIGTDLLESVNLTWKIPNDWTNTSGTLYSITSSLASDARFYSNITIQVFQNATLGPKIFNLTADSPNATAHITVRTINITASTFISQITTNKSNPLRNEPITILAKLRYDNGSAIINQNITFQQNFTALTNSSGDAEINYTIPGDATLGSNLFPITVEFIGNDSLYILSSSNTTNITITDILPITQNNYPALAGYGLNITINATITSTSSIDTVIANITSPQGQKYQLILSNYSQYDFEGNFSQTWQQGRYNYTIWANNTAGFSNETASTGFFNVESNLSINLKTDKDGYIKNEIVNLTNLAYAPLSLNVKAESGEIIVAATATTNTRNLANTYQLNKSFIVADSQIRNTATDAPNQRMGRVYFSSISNGFSSQLTAQRSSATNNMRATYSVIQADNINSCHISYSIPQNDVNEDVSLAACSPAIPSNYQDKCFVSSFKNFRANSGTDTCSEEQLVMANITNSTNLNLQRSNTTANCGITDVEAQVVCFNDGTNVTPLYTGAVHFSSSFATAIGHTVDLDNSWLMYSCLSNGQNGAEHTTIECYYSTNSQVTCRTSSLGTTENSIQQCIMYVIEFYDARNAEVRSHIPTDADVANVRTFNSSITPALSALDRTLGTCSYSLRNNEGNTYAQADYPCYIMDDQTLNCEHGSTTANNPSHDFHCQFVQWPNETLAYYNPSYIQNLGSTGILAPLLMTVQSNSSGSWQTISTIVNDSATGKRRNIESSQLLNLTQIWNGPGEGFGFNTGSSSGGYYRAFAAFTDPNGSVLTDGSGNNLSSYYQFEVDFRPPTVTLSFPENDSTNYGTRIKLNFTATDPSGVDTCSLFHDKSGFFTLEQTQIYQTGQENNFTIDGFTENSYIRWNVRCNDTIGNEGFTATDLYFYLIVPPDFTINSTDIGINLEGVIEGTNVTINATVYNLGGQLGTTVVQFYDGDPAANGTQINGNTSISVGAEGGINTTRVNWTAQIGPHNIFVILDPPLATNGSVIETNETNNQANITINVNAWQDFYGNATISKLLATESLSNLTLWANETALEGTIFVADTESNINWVSLQAIGKNVTGGNTTNDFAEIDSLLNMTNFIDSISNTFTFGGSPRATTNFFIRKQTIYDVPIINSSSNSNFVTGLLWDTNKDTNSEFDSVNKEDLVFATKFNESKSGKYGTYDYEIKLPVKLRNYYETESSRVYFYFELN